MVRSRLRRTTRDDGWMRVTMVGLGSVGDVAPLLTLGRALRNRGHQARLVALAGYADLCRDAGVELVPVAGDTTSAMWPAHRWARRATLAQPGLMYLSMRRRLAGTAEATTTAILTAATDADVLVPGLVTHGACQLLGAERGIPVRPLLFAPLLPGRDPASACLALPTPSARLSWASSSLMWRLTQLLGSAHTAAMADRLGRRLPTRSEVRDVLLATSPVVSPLSPAPPAPRIEQTGWIPASAARPPLPPDLVEFLDEGPPPVLMTFGSCPVVDPAADLRLFLAAARRAGVRVVVQSTAAPEGPLSGDPSARPQHAAVRDAFNAGSVDHAALLPRVRAVVHHGGAGTTYAALAAGRPAVVVPHLGDQSYYARRVHDLGAGPAGIPRWRLTPRALAPALADALEPGTAAAASAIARRLATEDGPARVVEALERAVRTASGATPG